MHDIEAALNALETVVKGREDLQGRGDGYYTSDEGRCVVGEALYSVGVTDEQLQAMGGRTIRFLYETGRLPLEMTLGAVLVYRAAQNTQDGLGGADESWGAAFNSAIKTAGRFMDLMPDSVVRAATSEALVRV